MFDLSPKGQVSQPWEALKEKLSKVGRMTSAEVWRLVRGQEVSEAEALKSKWRVIEGDIKEKVTPKAAFTPDPANPLLWTLKKITHMCPRRHAPRTLLVSLSSLLNNESLGTTEMSVKASG